MRITEEYVSEHTLQQERKEFTRGMQYYVALLLITLVSLVAYTRHYKWTPATAFAVVILICYSNFGITTLVIGLISQIGGLIRVIQRLVCKVR